MKNPKGNINLEKKRMTNNISQQFVFKYISLFE